MKQLRNIAVSGVTTQEQYDKVCHICGDTSSPSIAINTNNLVIYDDGDVCDFMYYWEKQDYSHCTLYTYEEFIATYQQEHSIPQQKQLTSWKDIRLSLNRYELITIINTLIEEPEAFDTLQTIIDEDYN